MANPVVAKPSANLAAAVHAKTSVPLFGGNASGKKRADGLKPGSPEALAADRERDAKRKRDARAARAAAAEPPALPAAAAPAPGAGEVDPRGVSFNPEPVIALAALVAWESEKIKPLTDQLIGLVEDTDVSSLCKVARDGALPDKVVRKIEGDACWPKAGKLMVERSTAKLAAKYLNLTGVSAAYQDELEFVGGAGIILGARRALLKELRAMIADFKAQKPEEKKP